MSRMTESPSVEPTPDQQLSAKIVQQLRAKGFVADGKSDQVEMKIASGQMKAEDWRTLMASALVSPTSMKAGEA